MADNYLEFSEVVAGLSREEEDWINQQLGADPSTGCPVFLMDYEGRDPDDKDYGFAWAFEECEGNRQFWVYADGWGEVDPVIHLVQKFLKRFRSDQCWSLTYANTCSKLRVGEFGGGAVFVTAEEVRCQNAYEFVEEQRAAFQQDHTPHQEETEHGETTTLQP